jgi:hypothetical protein
MERSVNDLMSRLQPISTRLPASLPPASASCAAQGAGTPSPAASAASSSAASAQLSLQDELEAAAWRLFGGDGCAVSGEGLAGAASGRHLVAAGLTAGDSCKEVLVPAWRRDFCQMPALNQEQVGGTAACR